MRAIVRLVRNRGRCSQASLVTALRLYPRAVEDCLKRLRTKGLVEWKHQPDARAVCPHCGAMRGTGSVRLTTEGERVVALIKVDRRRQRKPIGEMLA